MSRRDKIAAWMARPAFTNGEVVLFLALGFIGGTAAAVLGWHEGAVAFAAPGGVCVLVVAGNAVMRSWQMRRRP